jgi:hypothetical protein
MLSKDAQAMAEAIRDGDLQGLSAAQFKDLNLLTRPIIRRQLDGGAHPFGPPRPAGCAISLATVPSLSGCL